MFILYFALAAFFGGVVAALIGWIATGSPFDAKTFLSSVLKALVAGAAGAIAGAIAEPSTIKEMVIFLITAFVAGAGVDTLGNRVGLAMSRRAMAKMRNG
jgi:hypothetical protein